MFKKLSQSKGFTLIELITAVIIASIFLFTVLTMIVSAFDSMRQAFNKTEEMTDIRYWGKRLKYQLRTATTPPLPIPSTTFGPSEVQGGGDSIMYQTLRKDITRFLLHKISLSSQDVVHETWYSAQPYDPQQPVDYNVVVPRPPDESEVMLKGVTALHFNTIVVTNATNPKTKNKAIEAFVTKPPFAQKSILIDLKNTRTIPDNP